jgi:hypothetical protein
MYTFLTQYNSPNFTSATDARATYGRARTIEKIAIHWWGDPAQNPTFEGVVAHLSNPSAQVSAHFVATGTGRRVACLVDTSNISWATVSANPYTISIECDPRCRDEDYDVVGELVAELRATFGNLPLMRHSDVYATACPGNYSLDRINAVATTKIAKASDAYGLAVSKTVTPVITRAEIEKLYLDILERPADEGGIQTYLKSGMNAGGVRNALMASPEYATLQANKAKAQAVADAAAKKAQEEAIARKAEEDAKARAEAEAAAKVGYTDADRTRDNETNSIIKWLRDLLAKIFK